MNFGATVNEINRVGTRVERNIDDIWFPAIVVSVSQVESISAVVTVRYLDDDRIEHNIPLNQLRLLNREFEAGKSAASQKFNRNGFYDDGGKEEEEQQECKQPEIIVYVANKCVLSPAEGKINLQSTSPPSSSSMSRYNESKGELRGNHQIITTDVLGRSSMDSNDNNNSGGGSTSAKSRYAAGGALKALRYLKHTGEEDNEEVNTRGDFSMSMTTMT